MCAEYAGFFVAPKIRTIVIPSSRAGKLQNSKNKTAAHGDMSRRDEEDIEGCLRSIYLWGGLFIEYYNVACQAFFFIFLNFHKIQYINSENTHRPACDAGRSNHPQKKRLSREALFYWLAMRSCKRSMVIPGGFEPPLPA